MQLQESIAITNTDTSYSSLRIVFMHVSLYHTWQKDRLEQWYVWCKQFLCVIAEWTLVNLMEYKVEVGLVTNQVFKLIKY